MKEIQLSLTQAVYSRLVVVSCPDLPVKVGASMVGNRGAVLTMDSGNMMGCSWRAERFAIN